MKQRSGAALILCLALAGALMVLAVIMTKIVYNSYATIELIGQREKAFWLAEAGLEAGKAAIAHNPDSYTDPPHSPEDDIRWLTESAVGERGSLPSGTYKMVREKDLGRLYAVGWSGRAKTILKLEFTPVPFKTLVWSEL